MFGLKLFFFFDEYFSASKKYSCRILKAFLLTVTVISSSFMKAFLVQSTHKQLNYRRRALTEVIVFDSAGNVRQIPLRCRWSGPSKELSPAVPLPLLFDVLTSLVQPPERSPCSPQSRSLLLWNVYRNFMNNIRTKCL